MVNIPAVAIQLHEDGLIGIDNKLEAENEHNKARIRASGLTQILLDAIYLEKSKFKVIGRIFNTMEALKSKRAALFDIFGQTEEDQEKQGDKEQGQKQKVKN